MPDKKTLTLEIARKWDSNTSLREYTSIDEDAAKVLAVVEDADLDLLGLTSLTDKAAEALSKQKTGSLILSGLTFLEKGVPEAFSNYEGFLGLEGLTSLQVPEAQALSKSVQSLDLSGLALVSDPVADALSKCKGRVTLRGLMSLTHAGLAAKLAQQNEELDLRRLTVLSNDVATALSKTKGGLLLTGLNSISNFDLAWKLFLQKRGSYPLSFLTSVSPTEAAILSNFEGDIYLDGVCSFSDDKAAEMLSQHHGTLGLRGLTSLTDIAAEALSKHNKGILILPRALSTKVADHFLRRYTKGIHSASRTPSSDGTIRAIDLQHGMLYDCTVDSDVGGKEKESFVQLAIDATTNRRFVLLGAKNIYSKDPQFVDKLIDTDFYFLYMEKYPDSKWAAAIREFILDEDGTLHDDSKSGYLSDFKETDVIK